MDGIDPQAQMEMLRRRAQMPASSAGIGTDSANSMSPQNPLASEGTSMMTNPDVPQQTGGAAGFPSDGAASALKKQTGEASKLASALIYRMKKLTDGQASQ